MVFLHGAAKLEADKVCTTNISPRIRTFKLIILGKLSNKKSNKTWELVQSGDDPPPLTHPFKPLEIFGIKSCVHLRFFGFKQISIA